MSVKPMVEGFTGGGDLIPNSVIHGVPVWRLQRGASAVIMPPVEGDIGLIAICDAISQQLRRQSNLHCQAQIALTVTQTPSTLAGC